MLLPRIRLLAIAGLTALAGCYHHPYMNYGSPYGQPMYAPPQNLNQGAPGTLYIPESNAPPYDPSTYDDDIDDWRKSPDSGGDGSFFGAEDSGGDVPIPRELNNGTGGSDGDLFKEDF